LHLTFDAFFTSPLLMAPLTGCLLFSGAPIELDLGREHHWRKQEEQNHWALFQMMAAACFFNAGLFGALASSKSERAYP